MRIQTDQRSRVPFLTAAIHSERLPEHNGIIKHRNETYFFTVILLAQRMPTKLNFLRIINVWIYKKISEKNASELTVDEYTLLYRDPLH